MEIKNKLVKAMYMDACQTIEDLLYEELNYAIPKDEKLVGYICTLTKTGSKGVCTFILDSLKENKYCKLPRRFHKVPPSYLGQLGRILGILAAENDCRPEKEKEMLGDVSMSEVISYVVHQIVRDFKRHDPYDLFQMPFFGDELEMFFTIADTFVLNFAEAYVAVLNELAAKKKIKLESLEIKQAIEHNKAFFFGKEDAFTLEFSMTSYRYYNFFGKKIRRARSKRINKGVYERLQKAY